MHVIGKLRIEAKAGGPSLARKVDRWLADRLDPDLSARLTACFDRLADGRTLRFDTLEIDLGEMAWADFERDFSKRVTEAVEERVRSFGSSLQPGAIPAAPAAGNPAIPLAAEQDQAWWFFLRHGHLPWWFAESRWQEIESPRELHESDPAGFEACLLRLAAEFPDAVIRLARQASTADLQAMFGKPGTESGMTREDPAVAEGMGILTGWLMVQTGGEKIVRRIGHKARTPEREGSIESKEQTNPFQPVLPPSPVLGFSKDAGSESHSDEEAVEGKSADIETRPATPSTAEGLPVRTAGLILLHPFIGRLFRHFGWLDGAGGIDPEWRWHAVQALQYLALGRCGLPEPTLVLEKTLCGIPLHHPAAFPALDEAVLAECEDLLAAVIGHWSILGKTSPDGLRESFLKRHGLLDCREQEIRLAVERQPYDLLLAHLPWPTGPVSFTWLKRIIHVHWGGESRT